MTGDATIVWLRRDLRIEDNPALLAGAERGGPVIPVFVGRPPLEDAWSPGAAARWWLHHSLEALATSLEALGSRLVLRRGDAIEELLDVCERTGATAVAWNATSDASPTDAEATRRLAAAGIATRIEHGGHLFPPGSVRTRTGGPYQVFTPFWRACLARAEPRAPRSAPSRLRPAPTDVATLEVSDLGLLPAVDGAEGLREAWTPGEAGALAALERFVGDGVFAYAEDRDLPARPGGTSSLSPHLHWGEVSPHRAWHAAGQALRRDPKARRGVESWRRQLIWREFAEALLVAFPDTPDAPLRESFETFPWRDDPSGLRAWQRGETGYPFVDAGMRQLRASGFVHNRVRMVVASFLVKDLLISWKHGAAWFWENLVDADLANNTLGWQWVSGCGADAAPYFRIFDPVKQGRRWDPDGEYVRRWVPELARLPGSSIHEPGRASSETLAAAGVRLGVDYPEPIVDHREARQRALAALATMKEAAAAQA